MKSVHDTKYARRAELGSWVLERNREGAKRGLGDASILYRRDADGWTATVSVPLGPVESALFVSGHHPSVEAAATEALSMIGESDL